MSYRDLRDFLNQLETDDELRRIDQSVSPYLEMTALSERVLREVKANSVVLFHDGPKERGRTVAALPRILNELESRGYTVCVPRAEDFQV